MTTVKDIQRAVANLPKIELDEFRSWFDLFDNGQWDKQFEEDVRTGKLDRLANQALKDFEEGRCTGL